MGNANHLAVLSKHARSFRLASLFLSNEERIRVAELYAFCRAVDDIADESEDTSAARRTLEQLRAALRAEPTDRNSWPLELADFRDFFLREGIDFAIVADLIDGVVSDLDLVRVADDEEFLLYCYRVAGTVGLMMCDVLGVKSTEAKKHAIDLGIAMQITNICRDVLEDANNGRVYLPADRLRQHGMNSTEPEDCLHEARVLSRVVTELLEIAETRYQSGDDGMVFLPTRARWAILVASRLYRAIGRRLLQRQNANPLVGRTIVPRRSKFFLVARATLTWIALWVATPTRSNRGA